VLNVTAEVLPPPAEGVRAFPDDKRPNAFYLVPAAPTISRDEEGRPEVSFMIYGRREGEGFRGQGGLLTLTTALAVNRSQREAAETSIRRRLALERGLEEPPSIEISPVEWVSGTVTVSLVEGVRLEGRPSLTGPNTSAFSLRLTQEAAAALAGSWKNGLPGARIRYDMRVRGMGSPGGSPLVLEGALGLSLNELRTTAP